MLNKNTDVDIGDVYFIFGDNIYEQYLDYNKFKALLNFYALLYGKVIIPDAFFINNKHLQRLFIEDNGIEYINRDIIVPSLRNGINNVGIVYDQFKSNQTLIYSQNYNENTLKAYLEKIESNKGLIWNIDNIADNFTRNILENTNRLNINDEDKLIFENIIHNMKSYNTLTRKNIRNEISKLRFKENENKEIINSYIDVLYNFNIPNYWGTSVGYPEELMNNKMFKVSPKEVFLGRTSKQKNIELISPKEHIITTTNLFNIGVLSNLKPEQIEYIRTLKEYKMFLKEFRHCSKNESKLTTRFIDYIEAFDEEIKYIIKWENKKKVNSNKIKLQLTSMGTDTISGDGVGFAVGLIMDGLDSFLVTKLLGKAFTMLTKPVSKSIERENKDIKRQGEYEINKIKTDENIYTTIKQFGFGYIK